MESGGLIGQLGIDWKLFLSQAVNFFILLLILRFFVYKPLLKAIKKRQEKIQSGLDMAQESEVKLKEVDRIAASHLKKAGEQSVDIIRKTEQRAEQLKQSLQQKAKDYQAELMHQADLQYKKQQQESREAVLKEAAELVKKSIIKAVELNPKDIDEALIKKAVSYVDKER